MNIDELNRFVFYGEWADHIEQLPEEIQDKILAEIVRYGIGKPRLYEDDMMVSMAVNFTKGAIDKAKYDYVQKVCAGKNFGRKKSVNDEEIYNLARQGKKAQQIADELGLSKSTVDHSEGWKNRKDQEFKF